jgi:hypothetical protein
LRQGQAQGGQKQQSKQGFYGNIAQTRLRQAVFGTGLRFVSQLKARPSLTAHSCSCLMYLRLTAIHSPHGPNDAEQSASLWHCSHSGFGLGIGEPDVECAGFCMQAGQKIANAIAMNAERIMPPVPGAILKSTAAGVH